jgi:multiple sugar transport system ATP-binding protein
MADLVLDRIVKDFGTGERALDEVTLHVADGELLAVVGPSGCGKTTLLRVAAGLESPTSGTVWIGGEDVTRMEPHRRDVAMVFQGNALYPNRNLAGNLAFPLTVRGVSKEERQRRVAAEAQAFRLTDFLESMPNQLSAGHQQAAQTAKAMVRAPRLFLMDEPLARIDVAQRREMRHEIALVQKGYGVTMVYVTNDREEAMALGDRVAIMRSGRLHQVDTPRRVFDHPADRFVAGFAGEMSFLSAAVRPDAGGYRITVAGTGFQAWSPSLEDRTGLVLGIRPHRLLPLARDPRPDVIALDVMVSSVEQLGTRAVVRGLVGGEPIQAALSEFEGTAGETVSFCFSPADVHGFDDATGATLFSPSGPAASDGAPVR